RNRSRQPLDGGLAADERRLEALAFGLDGEGPDSRAPPGFPSLEAAATTVPLWDGPRVLAVARRREYLGARATPAAAALLPHRLGSGRATWIVVPMPDLDSLAHTRPIPEWTAIPRAARRVRELRRRDAGRRGRCAVVDRVWVARIGVGPARPPGPEGRGRRPAAARRPRRHRGRGGRRHPSVSRARGRLARARLGGH